VATLASKPSENLVINTLVVKPNTRSVSNIDTWRTALKAADRGKRERLYDLYEDLLIDNVLSSAVDKRITAITNSEVAFTDKSGKPNPVMDTLIETPEFEEIITEILNAKFWGKTVLELSFITEKVVPYLIPRTNVRVDLGLVVVNPADETGIPYRDNDFFLEAGSDKDYGLILKSAPYVIYKRGGFGDWAQFTEIFGMPFRLGKYSSHDEDGRSVLEQALEKQGSAAYMVIPKETEIELIASTTNANGMLYDKLRGACNEEILVGILGQTMTTLNGSSKSQSETHMDVEESKHKADRRFVQRILNTKLIPMLEKRGYPVTGGYFSFPEAGETLSTTEKVTVYDGLINKLHLNIDEAFLYETFSVPKGADKPAPPPPDPSKTGLGYHFDTEEEQGFLKKLFSFFSVAPAHQAGACSCGGDHLTSINLASAEVDNDALLHRVASGNSTFFDVELFQSTATTLLDALHNGFAQKKFVGIAYGFEPDALKTAMELNIFRFSATKTVAEVYELNKAFRTSKNFEEFSQKASGITNIFNKQWLQTEYDTAYLTAESSATYYRLKEQTDLFPYWMYATVGDAKVRPEHAELNGLMLPANDERWNSIYPPNGWRCRCYIVPKMRSEFEGEAQSLAQNRKTVDSYMKSPEWKMNASQGFDVNRAITGEVFTKNQQYIRKFPNASSNKLNSMGAEKWGLPTVEKAMNAAPNAISRYEGTAEEWLATNAHDNVATLTDYNKRSIALTSEVVTKHSTYAMLLPSIGEVLANPSEVWINGVVGTTTANKVVFIKYYNDTAMVVIGEISEGNIYQVSTWLEMEAKNSNDYRRGILIK